jgi:hypothetical protein
MTYCYGISQSQKCADCLFQGNWIREVTKGDSDKLEEKIEAMDCWKKGFDRYQLDNEER